MKEWFGTLDGEPFTAFGTSHITIILIYFIVMLTLIFTYKKINKKQYHTLRWVLFSILILAELSYQVWAATNGIWSMKEQLPLHLCSIASIVGAIALITQHKKLITITFFIGFIPPFLALLTPELPYDFPNFRFFIFFIHHITISFVALFLVLTNDVQLTLKSTFETYGYLLVYAGIIGIFVNPNIKSNYLYLANPPSTSTPLDLLGSGANYYLQLTLLGLVVFIGLYYFYRICRKGLS